MSDLTHALATTSPERLEFTRLLTGGRMNSYNQAASAGGGALDGLEMYSYNMALAGAYLGPVHILEVVTRNAIHHVMTAHTGRNDWWDSPQITLVHQQQDAVTAAENKVDKQLRARRTRTPDDVVAALDFGFWCGLLGRGDAAAGAHYERDLWQPALRKAFPYHRSTRGDLWDKFDKVRLFRNRITHHEPVHTADIPKTTASILRLTGLVSPPIANWVGRRTRLRYVAANAPGSATPLRTF